MATIQHIVNETKYLRPRSASVGARKDAQIRLLEHGWKVLGSGDYKRVYAKGCVVIKLGNCRHDQEAYKAFRQAGLEKYLPEVYFLNHFCMVQRKVNAACWGKGYNWGCHVDEISKRLKAIGFEPRDICYGNVGFLQGKFKVFDGMVSRRVIW